MGRGCPPYDIAKSFSAWKQQLPNHLGPGCPSFTVDDSDLARNQVGGYAGTDSWVGRISVVINSLVTVCAGEEALLHFGDCIFPPFQHVVANTKLAIWSVVAASFTSYIDNHYRGEAYSVDSAWYRETPPALRGDV